MSFLEKTGQSWKINSLVVIAVVILAGSAFIPYHGHAWVWVALVSAGVYLGLFTWVAASVRCPRCGARLFWKAVCERPILGSLAWLESLPVCPVCHGDWDS